MSLRINFVNPFGTTAYDAIIAETLSHYAREGTDLVVTHLEGSPTDIDYFYPKHIGEALLLETFRAAEDAGFDAIISGCCFDPAVLTAREVVKVPVIGPLEASFSLRPYFGRSAVIVTDHMKSAAYMRDMVKSYGEWPNVLGVEVIDWYVRDMVNDTEAVARDVIERTAVAMQKSGAETVILACTVIAACYQKYLMSGGAPAPFPILNPNLMGLAQAESLAHLNRMGGYDISQVGYYMAPPTRHYQQVEATTRKAWQAAAKTFADSYHE